MLLMNIFENITSMFKRAEELIDDLMKVYMYSVKFPIINNFTFFYF